VRWGIKPTYWTGIGRGSTGRSGLLSTGVLVRPILRCLRLIAAVRSQKVPMGATVRSMPTSRRKRLTRGPGPAGRGQWQELTARNWEAMYGALLEFCPGFVLLGWAGLQCPPCTFAKYVEARVKPAASRAGESTMSLPGIAQTTILAASWSRKPVVLIDKDRRG
jgi:hypothetical protein